MSAEETAREILRLHQENRLGGKWYPSGPPWGDHGYIYAGSDDPHAGDFIATCDDGLFFEIVEEEGYEQFATPKERAEYIALLKNEAPLLAVAYLKLLEEKS
jgi:hypothetical protein